MLMKNIQWNPSNTDTIGPQLCVWNIEAFILEASSIILVGVAMHIHAVECYKSVFQSFSLLYAGKED